jgi:hypothetical protein
VFGVVLIPGLYVIFASIGKNRKKEKKQRQAVGHSQEMSHKLA